ncbi:MAG: hypothetical protein ACR2MY_02400 [Candidatus Dormibacteria bacterium]
MVATVFAVVPASASGAVSVLNGGTYRTMPFPNDALTVADPAQLTGKRVDFRQGRDYPACGAGDYSACDVFAQLNHLDGFDLQPRITIPFSGPIDVKSVNDTDLFIQGPLGRTGITQLVWDPAANTLSGFSNGFLHEAGSYNLVVTSFITDTGGRAINACSGACIVPFTTMTATAELDHIRRALDNGSAFAGAGIAAAASRRLGFTQDGTPDVFLAASVPPSVSGAADGILRHDQTTTDPAHLEDQVAPNLIIPATAGYYAFGSFRSPRYQYRSPGNNVDQANGLTDGEIPMLPSSQTPQPFGADQIGVIMVLPQGSPPAGGWPVAIYGPGFTRSKFDIFVTADHNAQLGIATIATDPAGHSYGPASTVTVKHGITSTTFKTYGRGRNVNGDGAICDGLKDGVGPTEHVTSIDSSKGCSSKLGEAAAQELRDLAANPSHKPVDGLRSGLIQTVVDNMALVRTIALGVDVPTVGTDLLSHTDISYYGLSFGGIYGTMLMGTDPLIHRGLLNVPGGPIVDIARQSGFRHNIATTLKFGKPDVRNGGPGLNGFTESIPLRADPPMVNPAPGAIPIQELFGNTNWYDRSGSPESFAPLLRDRPLSGSTAKQLLFQTAFGDHTVPNPTAGILYRAGNLSDLVTYYRNDHSTFVRAGMISDPHGWLASPTIDPMARQAGELQLGVFLKTGQVTNTNPTILEVPIADISNLSCLHYNDPQTGGGYNPMADMPDCPLLAIDQHIWLASLALAQVTQSSQQNFQANGGSGLPNTAAGSGPMAALALGALLLAVTGGAVRRQPRSR